jgi:hypothetical protein
MRHSVLVGIPGPTLQFGAAAGGFCASDKQHDVIVMPADTSFDNPNALLAAALNMSEGLVEGPRITHFAMCHADMWPDQHWLDIALAEMDRLDLDLISAVIPIRDNRGVVSCGIGNPKDNWKPFRRFTLREVLAGQLYGKPETFGDTFTAADVGYPGMPLLHNDGLFVIDLRKSVFRQTDADGNLAAFFFWPKKIRRGSDGMWENAGESPDWFFSRKLWELGAKTAITRAIKLHHNQPPYQNREPWGTYERGDEATADNWRLPLLPASA